MATLRYALLFLVAVGTALTLLGAGQNTHYWGELTTPALFAAGLLAFGLGSLFFTPTRRRHR